MSHPWSFTGGTGERILFHLGLLLLFAGLIALPLVGRAGFHADHRNINRGLFAVIWLFAAGFQALSLRRPSNRSRTPWRVALIAVTAGWGVLGALGGFSI